MNKDLQIGQRVRLSDETTWSNCDENPSGIEGTVTDHDGGWASVEWDNGKWNAYRPNDSDLIPVDALV